MSNFLSYKGFSWEYETFGDGSEPLLAFPGFGNEASSFRVLLPSLGKRFRIFSFNLPFHGRSIPDKQSIDYSYSKNDLKQLFEKFLSDNSIKQLSVMGFSLGGKIALQLIESFPDSINNAFLFAPDGITISKGNRFVTDTFLGRKLYQRIIDNPTLFLKIVNALQSMNIVNSKLADFVHWHLSSRERRQMVWDVWMCFRKIKPNIRKIQHIINEKKINIHLFFGKYDSIISPEIGIKFVQGLKNKKALHILEAGHSLIREKMNGELSQVV